MSWAAAAVASLCLSACASAPAGDSASAAYNAATSQDPAARQIAESNAKKKQKNVWSVPTEAEVAAALDQKYLDAVQDFVKLKKNDEVMFCKRYREIGSSIARINCITASEVRDQVDKMTNYRDDWRNKGSRCTRSVGCSGGG